MSISSQLIQRIENAVYHEPYMIPTLFKTEKVKAGFIHSRLRRYVPHRVGIEFECFGDFANQYLKQKNLKLTNFEKFEKHFNVVDFSQNTSIFSEFDLKRNRQCSSTTQEEIRVSISDYRQLNSLYYILKEMAKYCSISDDCGIHIHIDLTKYGSDKQKDAAVDWFNKHLSEVESIFPKYTGTYNQRKALRGKGSWVNLSVHDTVEFRIAPLTFDYEVLIPWIIKCSKLVSKMIGECLREKYNAGNQLDVSKITEDGLNLPFIEDSEMTPDRSNEFCEQIIRELSDHGYIRPTLVNGYIEFDDIRGLRRRVNSTDACISYLNGGINAVINRASEIWSMNLESTITGNNYIIYNDLCNTYATSAITYVTSNYMNPYLTQY